MASLILRLRQSLYTRQFYYYYATAPIRAYYKHQ